MQKRVGINSKVLADVEPDGLDSGNEKEHWNEELRNRACGSTSQEARLVGLEGRAPRWRQTPPTATGLPQA